MRKASTFVPVRKSNSGRGLGQGSSLGADGSMNPGAPFAGVRGAMIDWLVGPFHRCRSKYIWPQGQVNAAGLFDGNMDIRKKHRSHHLYSPCLQKQGASDQFRAEM